VLFETKPSTQDVPSELKQLWILFTISAFLV